MAEAEEAVGTLRAAVAAEVGRLRELRARAPEPDDLRRLAVEAASADITPEAQLRHRYEMAHERSLRSTIKQLLDLQRSGADLPDPAEAGPAPAQAPTPQPKPASPDPAPGGPAPPATEPSASGSLGALGPVAIPAPSAAPDRGPKPPIRTAARSGGGQTSR